MWPLNDFSPAVMSPRAISCSVSSVLACCARMRALASCSNLAVPSVSAALDGARRQSGGHDDPPDHQQHHDRRGDEAHVELPVGAADQDHRSDDDRHQDERQQHEADDRQRADGALVLVDARRGCRCRSSRRREASRSASATTPPASTPIRPRSPAGCSPAPTRPAPCRRPVPPRSRASAVRVSASVAPAVASVSADAASASACWYRARIGAVSMPPDRYADAAAASAADSAAYRFCAE